MIEELIPIGFQLFGSSLDDLSTIAVCSKYGIKCETNKSSRKYMEELGITQGLIKSEIYSQASVLGLTCGLYFIDNLLGIQNEQMNLHKGFLYTFGSFRYLAALVNYIGLQVANRKEKRNSLLIEINYNP